MCMNVHTCTYQLLGLLASPGIAVIGKINCLLYVHKTGTHRHQLIHFPFHL